MAEKAPKNAITKLAQKITAVDAAERLAGESAKEAGFSAPAEWDRHDAVWLAWPSDASLWQESLPAAQAEFAALCAAIADVDSLTGVARGERLEVLVSDQASRAAAERALAGLPARLCPIPFGDIWLRDTAPVFLRNDATGAVAAARFAFNGWGKKYVLRHDAEVSGRIARATGLREFASPAILEGGSVELDGEGTCLTSRQCLLNPNRNGGLSQAEIERFLSEALGAEKVLWLGDGLLNDHTDGHVDTIARFVAPGVVLCMQATERSDPNLQALDEIAQSLASMRDARGRKLRVERVPSPGLVANAEGEAMPASYLNFYIANTTVVVPVYGAANDQAAVAAIVPFFPGRKVVGLPAKAILSGGGAFHCITQQLPSARPAAKGRPE
jgi:agmatine deiminase